MYVLVCVFRHVDFAGYSRGFCPAGQIYGVAEQTVPGHPVTNHSRHHLAAVYADGYALGENNTINTIDIILRQGEKWGCCSGRLFTRGRINFSYIISLF